VPAETPRWKTPTPTLPESANADDQLQALAVSLDDAAIDLTQNTLTNRPAASLSGRYFYATDYGVLFRDTGSAWVLASKVGMSSTLPSSPFDGQTHDLIVDATNGIIWRFTYRTASPAPYRWEYQGGNVCMFAESTPGNSFNASGSTYIDTSAGESGPAITVPRPGIYDVEFGCRADMDDPGGGVASMSIRTFSPIDSGFMDQIGLYTDQQFYYSSPGFFVQNPIRAHASRRVRVEVPVAPYSVTSMYRVYVASTTGNWLDRWMKISPVRIS
jgi:hypothetical protein